MRQLPLTAACVALSLALTSSGCRKDDGKTTEDARPPAAEPDSKDEFGLTLDDKRWWVEKAARSLHNGQGLTDDGEVARLAAMSYPDITNELMADDRFYETTLNFNFYYFGLKSDSVTYPKKGDLLSTFANYMRLPNAIDGARAVRDGGDYMAMLTSTPHLYAAPLGPVIEFEDDQIKVAADSPARRKEIYAESENAFNELIAMVQAVPQKFPNDSFCNAFYSSLRITNMSLGYPDYLERKVFDSEERSAIGQRCYEKPVDPKVMVPLLEGFRQHLRGIIAQANQLEPDAYMPQRLAEVREVDLKSLKLEDQRGAFGLAWFWQTLPNSSTNYDRKRANYVLKRFFCDDLTPVSVLLPKNHAQGKHAADPGCQSCHYKLDPMAGFFRYNGVQGQDFSKPQQNAAPKITFDDFAEKPLAEYVEAWRAPVGAGRTWDIGYVRSTTHPELNSYAAHAEDPTINDLFQMLHEVPEVKQCLVRRLFEYFVGPDQVVDSGYLEHLTQRFIDRTNEESSAAAFKETVASLVTSVAYRTKDPVSEQCYDRAPGDTTPEAERPPCRVAFILQKNCDTCHKGEGAAGGLDLARWGTQPDGHLGFRHVDADGQPVATQETLKRIYDRLGSTDPELRMPLNREIPVADRDALILWINKAQEAGR